MTILIIEKGQFTHVTINGHTNKHRTSFLKKLSYSDFRNYVIAEAKKV